jgi:hypothetical protein
LKSALKKAPACAENNDKIGKNRALLSKRNAETKAGIQPQKKKNRKG